MIKSSDTSGEDYTARQMKTTSDVKGSINPQVMMCFERGSGIEHLLLG